MNNGENIVYTGALDLRRSAGDTLLTNEANRSELTRTYWIAKGHLDEARSLLQVGYRAQELANMTLTTLPRVTLDETYAYFDCTFNGILTPEEGGNPISFETMDVSSNVVTINNIWKYVQPVNRYRYTISKDSPDRSISRVIPLPETVRLRNILTGDTKDQPVHVVYTVGEATFDQNVFFWDLVDVPRTNYGDVDEVIESWALTYVGSLQISE